MGKIEFVAAPRWVEYVVAVGQGEIVTRTDMAQRMGVHYSTAMYHLDRAVSEGALHRAICVSNRGNQSCWGYALPETMLQLEM